MRIVTLLATVLLSGCVAIEAHETPVAPASAAPPAPHVSAALGRTLDARIVNATGAPIGMAHFREGPWGVVIRLEFNARALTPGWHGVHLHQNGDCADFAAGFMASGGHVGKGMDGAMHGLLNPMGPEAGDLANIFAPDAGAFGAELYTPNVTLAATGQDWRMPLLTERGAALIVHASPDDHASQPIGGAGARVACAAIKP